MDEIRFAWDPRKAASNFRKHGVPFGEAATAFSDDNALVLDDPIHSHDEARFVLLGLSAHVRIVVVSYTLRDAGRVIRIISARSATVRERDQYFERVMP